jgi:hypothetical protein
MGEYGRKRVEEYFNCRRLADDVERVYRSVLGEADGAEGSGIDEKDGPV